MRYIVIEQNSKNHQTPNIKTFRTKEDAVAYTEKSDEYCRVFSVGSTMTPKEIDDNRIPY